MHNILTCISLLFLEPSPSFLHHKYSFKCSLKWLFTFWNYLSGCRDISITKVGRTFCTYLILNWVRCEELDWGRSVVAYIDWLFYTTVCFNQMFRVLECDHQMLSLTISYSIRFKRDIFHETSHKWQCEIQELNSLGMFLMKLTYMSDNLG